VFVELIEHLRCPAGHAPTPLVAAASRSAHRHILDGILGCPECGAEYPVRSGVAHFGQAPRVPGVEPSIETAMRIAAFLELTDARGFAVLSGRWGAHVHALAQLVETPLVLVNPPEGAELDGAAAVLETDGVLPIAEGAARALAIDADAIRIGATSSVRAGGRVLGPAQLTLPDGLREIARDAREWVAERVNADAPAKLVELKRGSSRTP
jgi:uncharacterized protein YbaR (Trm112 family)